MIKPTIGDAPTIAGDSTGTMLANRYRVVRPLGHGGMGSVWLVEDVKLDNKPFAVKMLPSILVSNRRAYEQVKREALIALKLVHPNIVQIRALEEVAEGGNPFLVMDYIDGQTLDAYLAEKGKLSAEEMVRLLTPVAEALDYAHGEGVVHRDVKPGNVMIRRDGRPFVLDFGIAREIQETMTRVTGRLSSGTLTYMSPEQLHGAVPKPAQDVYSFAAMAYECLTGAPPFSRGQIEYQIDHDAPAPINLPTNGSSVRGSGTLAASVMAGLAKKPEDRPPSCAAVLENHEAGASRPPVLPALDTEESQRIQEQITARVLRADELYQKLAPFRRDPAGLETHLQAADDNWAVVKAASVHAGGIDQALLKRTSSALASLEREFLWLQETASVRKDCRSVQERIKILETNVLSELGEHLRADACYVAAQKQMEDSVNLMQKGNFAAACVSLQKVEFAVKAAAEAVRMRRANERASCIKYIDDIMARVGNRAEREAEDLKDDPDYQKGCALSEEAVRLFDAGDFDGASRTYRTMTECFEIALVRLEKSRQEKVRALEAEVQVLEKEVSRLPSVILPQNFDISKIKDFQIRFSDVTESGEFDKAVASLREWLSLLAEAKRFSLEKRLENVRSNSDRLAVSILEMPDDPKAVHELFGKLRECRTAIDSASLEDTADGESVVIRAEESLAVIDGICQKIKDIRLALNVCRPCVESFKKLQKLALEELGDNLAGDSGYRKVVEKEAEAASLFESGQYVAAQKKYMALTPKLVSVRNAVRGRLQHERASTFQLLAELGDIATKPPSRLLRKFGVVFVFLAAVAFASIMFWRKDSFSKAPTRDKVIPGVMQESRKTEDEGRFERESRDERKAIAAVEEDARQKAAAEEATRKAEEKQMPKQGEVEVLMLPGGATMEMIYVEPCEFIIGSPPSEKGRIDSEVQHRVTLTKGYWLGKYEVTQRQWKSVMGRNPSRFQGDDRPVEGVSWEDCQEFIQKVNAAAMRQFGDAARLPNEAEWEYACRAGSDGPYAGNGKLDDMGWYDGNSGRGTNPVGQKFVNAWGFHDMHGNVWEWCGDFYGNYPNGEVTDPSGPASGDGRVLRGGSWDDIARFCRSAYRFRSNPGFRYDNYGFRLCCSAGPCGEAEPKRRETEDTDDLDSLLDGLVRDVPKNSPTVRTKDKANTTMSRADRDSGRSVRPDQGFSK